MIGVNYHDYIKNRFYIDPSLLSDTSVAHNLPSKEDTHILDAIRYEIKNQRSFNPYPKKKHKHKNKNKK